MQEASPTPENNFTFVQGSPLPAFERRSESPTVSKIVEALAAAQGEIENADKEAENKHFGSRYADLASVISAVKGPLSKHRIARTHSIEYPPDGVLVVSKLRLAEEWLACEVLIPLDMSRASAHAVGTAITYGRRYGLQAVTGIAAEDDDGNAATNAAPDNAQRQQAPRNTPPRAAQSSSTRLPPKCERCTKPIVGEEPTFNRERKPFHATCYEEAAAEFRAKQKAAELVTQASLPTQAEQEPPRTRDITSQFDDPTPPAKPASVPPPMAAAPAANDNAPEDNLYAPLKARDAKDTIGEEQQAEILVLAQAMRWPKMKIAGKYKQLFPNGPSLSGMRRGEAGVLILALREEHESRKGEVANG